VEKPLWRDGREIWYQGFIAPTTEGRDTATLIKTAVMFHTSIRAKDYQSKTMQMPDGQYVEAMEDAVIAGIDLTDEPGIRGAGIRNILEEQPVLSDPPDEAVETPMEEQEMEWEKVTLEDLVTARKDLLDDYVATLVEAGALVKADEKAEEEKLTLVTLTEELSSVKAKAEEDQKALAEAVLGQKIAEASLIGRIPQALHEILVEKVKTEEDIAKVLPDAREQAIVAATNLLEVGTKTSAKGTTKPEAPPESVVGEPEPEEQITEEARTILGRCV